MGVNLDRGDLDVILGLIPLCFSLGDVLGVDRGDLLPPVLPTGAALTPTAILIPGIANKLGLGLALVLL